MSTFYIGENINYEGAIVYNFDNIPITSSQVSNNGSYINIASFTTNDPANPNFYYTANGTTTSSLCQSASIYGLIHNNIDEITTDPGNPEIIGELVLTLTTTTNSHKQYLCFLLQQPSIDTNAVDNMITVPPPSPGSNSTNIQLNSVIPTTSPCIVYPDTDLVSTIFVFVDPISINEISAAVIDPSFINALSKNTVTPPFSKYPNNSQYIVIPSSAVKIQDGDQIYIDCNPTGESGMLDTYNVPINSEYSQAAQQIDAQKTAVRFAYFFLLLGVCWLVSPMVYQYLVVDKVIRGIVNSNKLQVPEEIDSKDDNIKVDVSLFTIDVILVLFFTILGIGFSSISSIGYNFAIYMTVSSAIAFSCIYIKRKYQPEGFMTSTERPQFTFKKPEEWTGSTPGDLALIIKDLMIKIIGIFMLGFKDLMLIIVAAIYGLILLIMGLTKNINAKYNGVYSIIGLFIVPFIAFFINTLKWPEG